MTVVNWVIDIGGLLSLVLLFWLWKRDCRRTKDAEMTGMNRRRRMRRGVEFRQTVGRIKKVQDVVPAQRDFSIC